MESTMGLTFCARRVPMRSGGGVKWRRVNVQFDPVLGRFLVDHRMDPVLPPREIHDLGRQFAGIGIDLD